MQQTQSEQTNDWFVVKDEDGHPHKCKMIKSEKEGVLYEIFIYDEVVSPHVENKM